MKPGALITATALLESKGYTIIAPMTDRQVLTLFNEIVEYYEEDYILNKEETEAVAIIRRKLGG